MKTIKAAHFGLMNYFMSDELDEITFMDQVSFYAVYGGAAAISLVTITLGMVMTFS